MLFTIKFLLISYLFSFVLLLYKVNIFTNMVEYLNISSIINYVELEEIFKYSPLIISNYYSEIASKQSNLATFSLLMTTSHIFNKNETIKEERIKLGFIKQINELKKSSLVLALLVLVVISIEWNNLNVFSSAYQKGFFLTLASSTNGGVILGYDHLSIPFILLIGIIFPIVIVSNWTTVKRDDMKYYLSTILSSHYFLIIVFLVIDILMFYVSFEIILPFFFILLGMFGGVQKFRAMYYLFLYTLWGSLFMLVEFVTKIGESGTGIIELLEDYELSDSWSIIGAMAIVLAFSVKTPIVPFHLWLPLAHGDANVSGSIVLASIVLKMALYGFIRILIFILLLSFATAQVNMLCIFIFSLIFASTTTIRQNDLKVLVAYSSVAHMGSTLLGGFSNNHFGLFGSILFGIAHGVVSPALFIFVGAVFYDRIGSRIVNYLKGLALLFPLAAVFLLPVIFGNMGTPLTANFIAEFLCIFAAFSINLILGSIAALSIIFSAIYSIYMYNRMITGSYSVLLTTAPDVNKRESVILLPLIIIMCILGIYPYLLSAPIDLGLSHFLLSPQNPILLVIIFSFLFEKFKFLLNILKSKLFSNFKMSDLLYEKNNIGTMKFSGCILSCLNFRFRSTNTLDTDSIHSNDTVSVYSSDSGGVSDLDIPRGNRILSQIKSDVSAQFETDTPKASANDQVVADQISNWINSQAKIFVSRYGDAGRISQEDIMDIIYQGQLKAIRAGIDPSLLGYDIPSKISSQMSNVVDNNLGIKGNISASNNALNNSSNLGEGTSSQVKSVEGSIVSTIKKEIATIKGKEPQRVVDQKSKDGEAILSWMTNDGKGKDSDTTSQGGSSGSNGSGGVLYSAVDQYEVHSPFIEFILDWEYTISKFLIYIGFTYWAIIASIIIPIYCKRVEIIIHLGCLKTKYILLWKKIFKANNKSNNVNKNVNNNIVSSSINSPLTPPLTPTNVPIDEDIDDGNLPPVPNNSRTTSPVSTPVNSPKTEHALPGGSNETNQSTGGGKSNNHDNNNNGINRGSTSNNSIVDDYNNNVVTKGNYNDLNIDNSEPMVLEQYSYSSIISNYKNFVIDHNYIPYNFEFEYNSLSFFYFTLIFVFMIILGIYKLIKLTNKWNKLIKNKEINYIPNIIRNKVNINFLLSFILLFFIISIPFCCFW